MKAPIPQFEMPLNGDVFRLVQERANDAERIEAERRQAEENARANAEFQQQHQITFA